MVTNVIKMHENEMNEIYNNQCHQSTVVQDVITILQSLRNAGIQSRTNEQMLQHASKTNITTPESTQRAQTSTKAESTMQ